jgi:hypothetical protein
MEESDQKMGTEERQITRNIRTTIEMYGHAMRVEDGRTARQVAEWNSQGQGTRGRTGQYIEGWD